MAYNSVKTLPPGQMYNSGALYFKIRKDLKSSQDIGSFGPWFFDRQDQVADDPETSVQASALCTACIRVSDAIRPFVLYGAAAHATNEADPLLLGPIHHHRSWQELVDYAQVGCHLCSLFWAAFQDDSVDEEYKRNLQIPADTQIWVMLSVSARLTICAGPNAEARLRGCLRAMFDRPRDKGEPNYSEMATRIANPTPSQLSRTTGSKTCLLQVSNWLDTCRLHHDTCRRNVSQSSLLPTRLIDLGESNGWTDAKLVDSINIAEGLVEYATLSHCWGRVDRLMLTKDNMKDLKKGIPFTKLAKTFQHAFEIASRLGFRYIWIDNFCIVQDDQVDWAIEAVRMADIYGNSECNIAAVGLNSEAGCFVERNPLSMMPCALYGGITNDLIYYCPVRYYYQTFDLLTKPFFERAWIFQERALSRRTVFFGAKELAWECNLCEAIEATCPEGRIYEPACRSTDLDPKKQFREIFDLVSRLQVGGDELALARQDFINYWHKTVKFYSQLDLTYETDRLIAIAGVAERIARINNYTYVAGLWHECLEANLLWRRWSTVSGLRISPPCAPSWSWASTVKPNVRFFKSPSFEFERHKYQNNRSEAFEHTTFCTIEKLDMAMSSVRRGSSSTQGSVTIRGLLQPIVWWLECDYHWASPRIDRPNRPKNLPWEHRHLCDNPEQCGECMNEMAATDGELLWYLPATSKCAHADGAWYFHADIELEDSFDLYFLLVARFREQEQPESEFVARGNSFHETGLVLCKEGEGFTRVGMFHRRHPLDQRGRFRVEELLFEDDGVTWREETVTIY